MASYECACVDPVELCRALVEMVRTSTQLPYEQCQATVSNVIGQLANAPPPLDLKQLHTTSKTDLLDLETNGDVKRLRKVMDDLYERINDKQQRTWSLYADMNDIDTSLTQLSHLITTSDVRVSMHVLAEDDYYFLLQLVSFYQMEIREPVRDSLLRVLLCLANLKPVLAAVVLSSNLPLEFAREFEDISYQFDKNYDRYSMFLQILVQIFSLAELPPFSHYDHLNCKLLVSIISEIEDERAPELFLDAGTRFIISFNLHFTESSENIVMDALNHSENVRHLSERLVAFFNRDEDPLWCYETCAPYTHSVTKLLIDIFSCEGIGTKVFYLNDADVLIDIIIRRLNDLEPGKMRSECLQLLKLMLDSSDVASRRIADLQYTVQCIQPSTLGDTDAQYLQSIRSRLIVQLD